MLQVGKLYYVNERIINIPIYERVHYLYPDPSEDFYVSMYDNRFIDWYDPVDSGWGYRYNRDDLRSGDIILILDINENVLNAWSMPNRPDYIAIKFLRGDMTGWIYQPRDSGAFVEIEKAYNLAAK